MIIDQLFGLAKLWPSYDSYKMGCVITADTLDYFMGITPADNVLNYDTNINWLSNINGKLIQSVLALMDQSKKNLTAWGLPTSGVDLLLSGIIKDTAKSVAEGEDPDLVARDNLRIDSAYAEGIKRLVEALTCKLPGSDNAAEVRRVFDRDRCRWLCETPLGQTWLIAQLMEMQMLEWQYHSVGETRIKAYKRLLRSLFQVITGQVLSNTKKQPYRRVAPDGQKRETDEQYLISCENRLLELLAHDAFDVRRFALTSPWARIGYCHWEEVTGSAMHTTRLRHYPLPSGIKANGKTLYIASPMINRCEIFDLAHEKSVISGMLAMGYDLYMVDYGNPGSEQAHFGLDYYGKTVHDSYLNIIKMRHPQQSIYIMAYCMGGTMIMPYLARRAEELAAEGKPFDIDKLVLMSTPIIFDDEKSGNKPMRNFLRKNYRENVMETFFGKCNVPPQAIETGMNDIQPGVPYTVYEGFFERSCMPGTIIDAAPFLFWLNSGTRFPARAHRQWIRNYMENEIWEGKYCLPSRLPHLDGKPVDMDMLIKNFPEQRKLAIFDYRGQRDPIAPPTACISSERWGLVEGNRQMTRGGLNRTIEKNIGHIFVVSKTLLNDFLQEVQAFFDDDGTAAECQ